MADDAAFPLRVQGSSRRAFGATTAALVTLASGGTALLVSQGTSGVTSPTALPPGALPQGPVDGGLVVGRVAGTPAAQPPAAQPPVEQRDPTEKALRDALAARREPGRRTLTAPLVPVRAHPRPVQTPAPGPAGGGEDRGAVGGVTGPGGPVLAPEHRVTHAKAHGHAPTEASAAHAKKPHGGKHVRTRAHGKGRHAR